MEQYIQTLQEFMVLIRCFTFNHSAYITDALNGFTMQQTNFPYVIILVDDASIDGEQEIIQKYIKTYFKESSCQKETDYAKIIFAQHISNKNCSIAAYFLKENHYSQKKKKGPYVNSWRDKCKYEALCEGDDYWIDSLKLQKQVDFLESHKEYTMCFANAIEHNENDNKKEDKLFSNIENQDYTGLDICSNWIIPTASIMFRQSILQSELYNRVKENKNFVFGDTPLFLTCAHYGKIRGMNDIVNVYRRHNDGATFIFDRNYNLNRKLGLHYLEIANVFGEKYKRISIQHFQYRYCLSFLHSLKKKGDKIQYSFLFDSIRVSFFGTIKTIFKIFADKIAIY